jgi:hypothetical protein
MSSLPLAPLERAAPDRDGLRRGFEHCVGITREISNREN